MPQFVPSKGSLHATDLPLCVDLDGTLLRSDLFLESIAGLLNRNLLWLFLLPLWLLRGKAWMKAKIAAKVDLDVETLPYHTQLLNFLVEEKERGRYLVLTTATNQKYAHQVAQFLGLFSEVIASDKTSNNAGAQKHDGLVNRYGLKGFDYAGNSRADLCVWASANHAIAVDSWGQVRKRLLRQHPDAIIFDSNRRRIKDYLSALRPHQWSKNILLFAPLVAAHQSTEIKILSDALIGFIAFCLCASAIYVINDIIDLPADRKSTTKNGRPFATGTIPISDGLYLSPLLLLIGGGLSLLLPTAFTGTLLIYIASTIAYSLCFKKFVFIDVVFLAGLYCLRLFAGGFLTGIDISFWLLAFSLFLFLSLAILKRYTEIQSSELSDTDFLPGRDYQVQDRKILQQFGITSGMISIVVLGLYINSDTIIQLYTYPNLVWLICPLALYWLGRTWILAGRGCLPEDPVLFAVKDRVSYLLAGLALGGLWMAA